MTFKVYKPYFSIVSNLKSRELWKIRIDPQLYLEILTLHQFIKGVYAKNLEVTQLFIDFSKAFNSIYREKMEQILLAYGLPKESVTHHYDNALQKQWVFSVVTGVLQGDTLV